MKIRNTTDFDTGALRTLILAAIRDVEATLVNVGHPDGWGAAEVQARGRKIRSDCKVWIRQRRGSEADRVRAQFVERAEHYRKVAAERAATHGAEHVEELLRAAEHNEKAARDYRGPVHTTGRASLSGASMVLTIPSPDPVAFAWLARHEVWHLFGIGHEHFPAAVMHENEPSLEAVRELYAKPIARVINIMGEIPTKAVPVKVAPSVEERASSKLVTIAEREKRWTTKLRRAKTALAKLARSRRYYERQIGIAAKR